MTLHKILTSLIRDTDQSLFNEEGNGLFLQSFSDQTRKGRTMTDKVSEVMASIGSWGLDDIQALQDMLRRKLQEIADRTQMQDRLAAEQEAVKRPEAIAEIRSSKQFQTWLEKVRAMESEFTKLNNQQPEIELTFKLKLSAATGFVDHNHDSLGEMLFIKTMFECTDDEVEGEQYVEWNPDDEPFEIEEIQSEVVLDGFTKEQRETLDECLHDFFVDMEEADREKMFPGHRKTMLAFCKKAHKLQQELVKIVGDYDDVTLKELTC